MKVGELAADEDGDGGGSSLAEAVVVGTCEVGEGTGEEILEGNGEMAEAESRSLDWCREATRRDTMFARCEPLRGRPWRPWH